MLAIIGVYALMGSTFAIFKMLLKYTENPIFIVSLSMLLGGLVYLGVIWHRKEEILLKKTDIMLYLEVIIFATFLPQVFRFWSLQHLSSIKLGLLTNLSPFITAGIGYFLSIEKLNRRKFLALLIGFIGSIPLLFVKDIAETDMTKLVFISWAEVGGLLSVLFFSYGFFIKRKMMIDKKMSPEMVNCIALLGSGVISLIGSFLLGSSMHIYDLPRFIMWLLLFTLTGKIAAHTIFNNLLKRYHPTLLSLASFLKPFFITLIGWLFLHEEISWHFFVSMTLVLFALILYYKEDLKLYRS